MKHEYLVELLKANKTVIVPNLGAISNNENPHHPFLFNEYLKFNDGMMAKHIASKEGISMDAAGEMISKFTNELQEILGAGKEVVIPGIGTLVKKDGKLHLDSPFEGAAGMKKEEGKKEEGISTSSITEKNKVEETKIIPPVVEKKDIPPVVEKKIIPPVVEKKSEPIVEKKPEPKIEVPKIIPPVVEKSKVEEPKIVPPVISTSSINDKPKVEEPKIIPPVVEKKAEPIISTSPINENSKPETTNSKQKLEKPKRKKKKLIWILLILLILGGGGTAGYLYKDELMKMMGMSGDDATASNDKEKKDSDKKSDGEKNNESDKANENTVVEEPIATDSIAETVNETSVEEPVQEEPIKVEEVVEDNKTQPITAESSTPGNYYIIVGCFQESTNADNMIAKISAAGMTPTNVGTFNGLAHIAAGSASDLSSALQQASSIRSTFAKVWILKR